MSPLAAAPGTRPLLSDAVGRVAAILTAAGVDSPDTDARWLVAHATGLDPWHRGSVTLEPDSARALDALVRRRAAREPLQLVLGETAFRTLTLACRSGVFVPRPETEVVAGVAIEAALAAGPRPVVGEPCTGTGAIACSLAAEVPGVRVVAGDLDVRAVAAARDNARRLREGRAGVDGPAPGATVEVRVGDRCDALPPALCGQLDVLVANPPYLPAADRTSWAPEVAAHDPDGALVGGADGHEIVEALLADAARWLRPGGTVVLEIDERRGDAARAAARDAGLVEVEVRRDLTGVERVLVARRATGPAPGALPGTEQSALSGPTQSAPRHEPGGRPGQEAG